MDVDPIEVQQHLAGLEYPATKEEVVALAEQDEAPQDIIEALQALGDEQFEDPSEIEEALSLA